MAAPAAEFVTVPLLAGRGTNPNTVSYDQRRGKGLAARGRSQFAEPRGDFHSLFDVFLFFRDRSKRARSARVGVSTPDASAKLRTKAS